jgi:hypothetical protein
VTAASCAADPPGTRMRWSGTGMHARRHGHAPGHPPGTRMRSPGTGMHARRFGRASGHRARVRRRRRAHVRWCLAINPSANKTTQKARAHPRRGRRLAARPRQTRTPMCSSRRTQCRARAKPCRAASALAVPTCRGQVELAQNRDEKGGAAARPSTHTMVLCTWTRGRRVRSPLRQGRPGRAARAAGRRTRSLFPSLSPILFPIRKGALARIFCSKKKYARTMPFNGQAWKGPGTWPRSSCSS